MTAGLCPLLGNILFLNAMDRSPYKQAVGKDFFRILLLGPGNGNEPVHCSLSRRSLSENIRYEALSYAWGDETSKAAISCNGTILHVTQSLELCLKALRSDSETRSLWIDQICINQDDLDEKSAQVSIMGTIYRSAAQVIVWLGPASPDSGCALSFIDELCQAFLAYFQLHGSEAHPFRSSSESVRLEPTGFELPPQSDRRWTALAKVLDRPWFSRYWVVQEVMLNREVVVQCGNDRLDWSVLNLLNWCLTQYPALLPRLDVDGRGPAGPHFLAAIGAAEVVLPRSNDRTVPAESTNGPLANTSYKPYSFSHLIQMFSRQSVTRDCDRIYSLMGIANSPVVQQIHINYRLSTSQIYMDFAVRSMEHDSNLDLLNLVEYPEATTLEALPSWVPDWTTSPKAKPNGIKYMECDHFRASGSSPTCKPFKVSDKKLLVKARLFDSVSSQRMHYPIMLLDSVQLETKLDGMISFKEEVLAFYGRVEGAINACQPYATGEPTRTIMCRLLLRDLLWSPYYYGPTIGDYQKAFSEEHEHIRWLREFNKKYEEWGNGLAMKAWCQLHPPPSTKHKDMSSFVTRLTSQLCGNAIVKTREGYMASVPEQTKAGDTLAVVNGCKTPLVLRRREPDGYVLIGDCYVHGLMYGEAMDMGLEETEIALV